MKDNTVSVRAYNHKPWYAKRVAKMPVGVLVALVLVAGIATAALVSKAITAPQSVQGATLSFKSGTTPPTSVTINAQQLTTIDAVGVNGYVGPIKLQIAIGSTTVSDTCATLALVIADNYPGGVAGKVATAVYPGGSTYVQLDIASGTNGVTGFAGGCTLPLTVSTFTLTGTVADAWNVRWAFIDFPNGSTVTWVFQAST